MSAEKPHYQEESGVETAKKAQMPPLYRVLLLNDDYTTMDFVVSILEQVFDKSPLEATQIMFHVHNRGVGLCGVYTRDIADTKTSTVHDLARKQGFPLKCTMEKE